MPRLVLRPVERFLANEAGSAALLLTAAAAALVWINVAPGSYESFWSTGTETRVGSLRIELDLQHVVNDLFMALFFYVVALEVKRELVHGDLRDRRAAAVPAAAALGTMVGAAAAYLAINVDGGETAGWAVPVATDIAFAIGALGLLGRRVPRQVRTFMLTLAIVDDIATILIIALVFTTDLSLAWLAGGLAAAVAIWALQRLGVRLLPAYVALAGLLWLAALETGIHPTIAGVVLGFLTPAVAFYSRSETGEAIAGQLTALTRDDDAEISEATIGEVSRLAHEAVSPLARMEERLHPWSAYLVLPVFALANAGVEVSAAGLGDALTSPVGLGILIGLVIGAPLGGILLAAAAVRATPARLPPGLDWPGIAAVAPLKGIGFTVAIFIASLAFTDSASLDQAKLAILMGSTIAAVLGIGALWLRHRLAR